MELLPFKYEIPRGSQVDGLLLHLDENDELTDVVGGLYKEHRRTVAGRQLIVVRCPVFVQRPAELQEADKAGIDRLRGRFPLASIILLSSHNYRLQLSKDLSENTFAPDLKELEASLLSCIRQREMEHFVEETDALMPENPGYRYHLPSGAYSESFLRVGNIQIGTRVLDATFFWMLPHLNDIKGMIVDTWSISSLALNTGRRLAQYDSKKADFRVEMLSHYHDGRPGTRKQLVGIASKASNGFQGPYLVLFSALMTGRSLRDVARTLGKEGGYARFLVLYRLAGSPFTLGNSAIPELCDFSTMLQEYPPGQIAAKSPKSSVEIDPQTYFPLIVRERVQRISKDFAKRNKAFFDRYRRTAVIRIHADAFVEGHFYRHHGIFIDIVEAIRETRFVKRLTTILLDNERPRLIIVPPHSAGRSLAELLVRAYEGSGQPCPTVFHSLDLLRDIEHEGSTGTQTPTLFQELAAGLHKESIVVLDDTVTTGERLLTFQRRLRELNYKGRIHYVVGVARMPSRREWSSLRSTLIARDSKPKHQVTAVESVVLPDWDKDECPWCQESHILDDIINANPQSVSQAMVDRAAVLRNSSPRGLVDGVFLAGGDNLQVTLSSGSYFVKLPATSSVVAASVAAALQEMREEPEHSERLSPNGFPLRSILGVSDLDRYTDSMLRAAIFRAATAAELRRTDESEEEKRALWARAILQSQGKDAKRLRRELLVAVLMYKVPRETLNSPTLQMLRKEGFREICDLIEHDQL
jgi:hypothetical protein